MDDTYYFRHNNVVYACSLYSFYMVEEEYISLALCRITGHQNNLHGIYNIWVVLVANKCLHHHIRRLRDIHRTVYNKLDL